MIYFLELSVAKISFQQVINLVKIASEIFYILFFFCMKSFNTYRMPQFRLVFQSQVCDEWLPCMIDGTPLEVSLMPLYSQFPSPTGGYHYSFITSSG